jgi:hypothetical protein
MIGICIKEERVQVVKLSQSHTNLVEEFCIQCKNAGYYNNSSLELMKWGGHVDLKEPPNFWALIDNDKIVSISGSHSFGVYSPEMPQIRCLFRSATLPEYSRIIPGLSKNHMNSIPFSILLPLQIIHGLENNFKHFYITTSNKDHDASGKMKKTHRAMEIIAQKRIVDFIKDEILKSNIRYEIVKPILLYILYYLIPFIIFIIFLNFITTIIAVCIVFKYLV